MSGRRRGGAVVVAVIGLGVALALLVFAVGLIASYDSSAPAPTQSVHTTEAARTVAVTPEYHR